MDGSLQSCHLYADGNFRLYHLAASGTATTHEPPLSRRFASNADVAAFCNVPAANTQPEQQGDCNNFQADDVLGREANKYNITGGSLRGVSC